MSKSLGNLIVVHKLLKTYTADAIRLLLAGQHYRQAWEFALTDLDTPRAVRVLGNLAQACLSGLVPDHEMPVARLHIRSMAEFLGLRLGKASE
jgi:cysteinyl-tRNA synthetase